MCGIVGYIGKRQVADLLVEGLSKLEYRGYDSAGVAIIEDERITVRKLKGRLANLENDLNANSINGHIGIGHTRWATHGEPSDVNSHPHSNGNATISVVHNGIIENYIRLREWLTDKGYQFLSETDTEVIPNLVDYYYRDERILFDAVVKATSKLEGSFAIGVIANNEPDKIIAVRKDSPLIVGLGENESFIASDIPAVLSHTKDVYLLNDNEFVTLSKDGIDIRTRNKEIIKKEIFHVTWDVNAAEKCGYEDFMLKEIHEQPKAVRDTLAGKIILNKEISFDNIKFTKNELDNFDKVYIVACGTAYHAGVVGKTVIEKLAKIPVEIDVASEFRYRDPLITDASTKAYVTQLAAFYILGLYFGRLKETITEEYAESIKAELLQIPEKIEKALEMKEELQKYADKHYNHRDIYFLGRGLDYAVAMEGSLKLKEISYIHCDAYAGGELKHGPIALIDKGTAVITLLTQGALKDKMVSNVREVSTRGGNIFAVVNEGDTTSKEVVDSLVYIPKTIDLLTPMISVVPLKLISYYVAKQKGCDVDKPRNLAKSVTVE